MMQTRCRRMSARSFLLTRLQGFQLRRTDQSILSLFCLPVNLADLLLPLLGSEGAIRTHGLDLRAGLTRNSAAFLHCGL